MSRDDESRKRGFAYEDLYTTLADVATARPRKPKRAPPGRPRIRPMASHAPGGARATLCKAHTNGLTKLQVVADASRVTCKWCIRLLTRAAAIAQAAHDAEYVACPHCGGVFKPARNAERPKR